MGRTLTVDGKRVSVGLKVSEAKAAAIDAARGMTPRALWLESLIDAALGSPGPRSAPRADVPPPARTEPPDRVGEVRALAEAAGTPLVPASELAPPAQVKRCGHPGTRMVGGFCKTCDHLIAPGGLWR